jgi:hypothetical protein
VHSSNGGIGVVNTITKQLNGETHGEFGANFGDFNTRELWGGNPPICRSRAIIAETRLQWVPSRGGRMTC